MSIARNHVAIWIMIGLHGSEGLAVFSEYVIDHSNILPGIPGSPLGDQPTDHRDGTYRSSKPKSCLFQCPPTLAGGVSALMRGSTS